MGKRSSSGANRLPHDPRTHDWRRYNLFMDMKISGERMRILLFRLCRRLHQRVRVTERHAYMNLSNAYWHIRCALHMTKPRPLNESYHTWMRYGGIACKVIIMRRNGAAAAPRRSLLSSARMLGAPSLTRTLRQGWETTNPLAAVGSFHSPSRENAKIAQAGVPIDGSMSMGWRVKPWVSVPHRPHRPVVPARETLPINPAFPATLPQSSRGERRSA